MSEKPILFNTEMVKAILDDRKTQTRRLIKPQPKSRLAYCYAGTDSGTWGYPTATAHEFWGADFELPRGLSESEKQHRWKPPCEADDILWVRETWNYVKFGNNDWHYEYRADCKDPSKWSNGSFAEWRPSIHMPREAARLFLLVKKVRIEKLQDISPMDVKAEGIEIVCHEDDEYDVEMSDEAMEKLLFQVIWEETIKAADSPRYGWLANPWVWVIEFERIESRAPGVEGG